MNIHEYQAKDLLREFGAPVPKGVVIYDIKEVSQKIKTLNTNNLVIKAQIHAGGRGKAGGIKLVKTNEDLIKETSNMFGNTLITHQTGHQGKKVKKLAEMAKKFTVTMTISTEYPPCIEHAIKALNDGENLSHSGRFMLATFLLGRGQAVDDVAPLFKNAPDYNEKVTRYHLNQNSGETGSNTKYSCPS